MIDFISTKTVSEAVSEKMIDLITSGKLAWGQKLPSQRELAQMLNVAVSSLREGLQILQATGYVEVKRGQGTYVAADPGQGLSRTLRRYLDADVRNLLEARTVLEVGVASLAARKAGRQDIEKMRCCLEKMETFLGLQGAARSEESRYDLEFHLALAESVGNPLLHQFVTAIRSSLERFIGQIGHTRKGLDYHWKVLEAVKNRRPEEAAGAMTALLMITERTYLVAQPAGAEKRKD